MLIKGQRLRSLARSFLVLIRHPKDLTEIHQSVRLIVDRIVRAPAHLDRFARDADCLLELALPRQELGRHATPKNLRRQVVRRSDVGAESGERARLVVAALPIQRFGEVRRNGGDVVAVAQPVEDLVVSPEFDLCGDRVAGQHFDRSGYNRVDRLLAGRLEITLHRMHVGETAQRNRLDFAIAAGSRDDLLACTNRLDDGSRAEFGANREVGRGPDLEHAVSCLSSVRYHVLDRLRGLPPLPVHHAQARHRQPGPGQPLLVAHAIQDHDTLADSIFHATLDL